MEYKDLSELILKEKYGRIYYNSLPVRVQSELSIIGDTIHSTSQLHEQARNAERRIRRDILASSKYI